MTTENDAKFIATMYLQQYGRKQAIEILNKLSILKNQEATALKNQSGKYNAAASILRVKGESTD